MKIPLVDLGAQYLALKADIDAAIACVIHEAAFVGNTSNRHVRAFEEQFAAYVGAAHCVACANGTDSLEMLLKAAGIGAGDEVVVPALSWIATSEAASSVGAKPVFADISADTYTLDPSDFARRVTVRTKAVIPVHLYGQPADMDPILEIAKRHGLFVLEDCAQAHGAKYRNRAVGTLGHAASFSFFPSKNLGAYGDAGGMVTNDGALAAQVRMLGQHGQASGKHDHQIEGRNSRMDGLQAAILSVKLAHLPCWTELRRAHARAYQHLLADTGLQVQRAPAEDYHVYHLFTVQVPQRDEVFTKMQRAGVGVTIQYPRALPLLRAYASHGYSAVDCPNAAGVASRVISLPMYPELTAEQIAYVVTALRAAVAGAAE